MTNFEQFIYNTYLDILIERLPDGYPTPASPPAPLLPLSPTHLIPKTMR